MEKTTLYLPLELQRALREEARRRRRPQADLIREALRAYLAAAESPRVRAVGLGDDPDLSARETEAWLDGEWSSR